MSANPSIQEKAKTLYDDLCTKGYDVLLDDRDVRPGQKFADSDLIGIPLRLVMSDKTVDQGVIECRLRTSKDNQLIPFGELHGFLAQHAKKSSLLSY